MSGNLPSGAGAAVAQSNNPIAGSTDFSKAVLSQLGVPVTATNIAALNAWQAAEGQWGATGSWNALQNHNPLNVEGNTIGHPSGASGVQYANASNPINIYPDWQTGVTQTVYRIQANPNILAVLRAGAGTAALSAAVVQSGWGTPSFANKPGTNQGGTAYSGGNPLNAIGSAGSGILSAAGDVASAVNPVSGVVSGLTSAAGVLTDVTSGHWWHRVGLGVGGVALIIGGVALFLASTPTAERIRSSAPGVAAAVAA